MIEVNDFLDAIFNAVFKKSSGTRVVIPIYFRLKEIMMYGIFGLGTFFVALITYALFTETFDWPILIGNALSWGFTTLFAFLTNRKWVFPRHKHGAAAFFVQLWLFVAGRLLTLGMEEFLLYFTVEALNLPNMLMKLLIQILVVTANYLFSKILVFRTGRKKDI